MNSVKKRAIISVIIFVVVYVVSGILIGWNGYDAILQGIKVLAAVIGAGCYWIGSNER